MPQTKTPAVQRATSLLHLPPLLADLGVSLDAVLDGTGVGVGALRPASYIPYAGYLAILERAAAFTGREDFGLLLGRRQTLASLGPLGRVMRHAATLGEALSDFASLQISNSTGGAVYLHRTANDFALGYGVYDAESRLSPQIHDVVLAVGCNLVAELTGGAVQPGEIHSIRSAPKDLAPYRELGECPVRFGQGQTCVFLPGASLDFRLSTADRTAREGALADLALRLSLAPWGMSGQVRHALRSLMLSGRTKMPDVAVHLGLHPKALRRALEREGTTIEAIKDEVRYAVARELLTLAPLPVGDIAMTLNFASPSSFVHAFRRWSGSSPARWRKR